jgi:hypothetical protein
MRWTRHGLWLLPALSLIVFLSLERHPSSRAPMPERGEPGQEAGGPQPSDWFGFQRAFPGDVIPQDQFRAAVEQAAFDRAVAAGSGRGQGFGALAATLNWAQAGPYNIGGRVTALASVPGGATVYLGAANGGVFKSTNGGTNWTPIFDELGVYSIGALELDPTDANVLYVGTGEANGAVDTYDGAGVFRSRNGGATWEDLGLDETARIGAVEVDPSNPNRIYVGAMGTQFSTGPHRGLYRSENGGASWTQVLFVNDSTGVTDVVINPAHPETVYCATWERVRRLTYRRAFGPGCGIWRSIDSGTTWTRLQNGLPLPSDNVGRIALAISPARPSMIYAQIISGSIGGYNGLGLYRSTDGGANWVRRDADVEYNNSFGGFGWYFGEMGVDPVNPEVIFTLGVALLRSADGGVTYTDYTLGPLHVDQHAIWIDPSNPQRIYQGNDGGFFASDQGGLNWLKSTDLPITQFYAGAIDPSNPLRLLGGTQDNNTLMTFGSHGPSTWAPILGGDGFQCLVDPTNPNIIFAEWQNCCGNTGLRRSTNGGGSFGVPIGFAGGDRYNWNTPIAMDPSNHDVLLVGSQRVYKSVNNGVNYTAVSADLTTNPGAQLVYGTITTLAISPVDPLTYYAGTDDGRVWRSVNAGGAWTNVSAGLPVRYVTRVTPDPVNPAVVYATVSGFFVDEHAAHVYRSANRGDTWASVSGNLPNIPVNDILVDPTHTQSLYAATDVGVYATVTGGASWFPLGNGLPIQTVFDLSFHAGSRTLVAATHGRSQWKLTLPSAPLDVVEPVAPPRLALSAPRPQPSRGTARLELELSRATSIDVVIYDASGRRVRTLLDGARDAGRHALAWDGADDRGHAVSPGVFFVRADAAGASVTRRLVRVR